MQGIEDQVTGLVRASMAGNLPAADDNHHLIDVGPHHHIAVGIGNRNRVIGVLVTDQRLAGDPARSFLTSLKGGRGQVLEGRLIRR